MPQIFLAKTGDDPTGPVSSLRTTAGLGAAVEGASVLIKPNLCEPLSYTTGQTTNPHLVEAVIRWCQEWKAGEVIVGEGPSYFVPTPSLKECFTRTGIVEVVERCNARWILFDEGNFRTYRDKSPLLPKVFRISEHAFIHDIVINLPVPKTHYLTTVSIAMKNLKGFLKQEDKPDFHRVGISEAVTALSTIIRPSLNLVDFTTPGPHQQGFLLAGRDIVAVDAVSASFMGLNPQEIPTIQLGSRAGLGEERLTEIEISGDDLTGLKMRYELPAEWLAKHFPRITIRGDDSACCGCILPLFASLTDLAIRGKRFIEPITIILGRDATTAEPSSAISIGNCPSPSTDQGHSVRGCPPSKDDIAAALSRYSEE